MLGFIAIGDWLFLLVFLDGMFRLLRLLRTMARTMMTMVIITPAAAISRVSVGLSSCGWIAAVGVVPDIG